MGRIEVYAIGIVAMSVCAPIDMTWEEIERQANILAASGTLSRWAIAKKDKFADGEPMPRVCEEDMNRLHWLLYC